MAHLVVPLRGPDTAVVFQESISPAVRPSYRHSVAEEATLQTPAMAASATPLVKTVAWALFAIWVIRCQGKSARMGTVARAVSLCLTPVPMARAKVGPAGTSIAGETARSLSAGSHVLTEELQTMASTVTQGG